jgi:hypothetical protein
MTELITAICSVAGTFLVLWGTVIYPRSKERKKLREEEEKQEAERIQDIDGIESASGQVVIPRLAVRVGAVEGEMKKVTAGQALLERRMDEANGTGRATRTAVEETHKLLIDLVAQGVASKSDLKVAAQQVAAEAVGRQTEVLHALAEHAEIQPSKEPND